MLAVSGKKNKTKKNTLAGKELLGGIYVSFKEKASPSINQVSGKIQEMLNIYIYI